MIQKIKNFMLAFSSVLILSFSLAPLGVSAAQDCAGSDTTATQTSANQQNCLNSNLCNGSNFDLSGDGKTAPSAANTANCKGDSSTLSSQIKHILNLLSALIGIVAVIMIIYAGFRYVTSAGSEGGVKTAKNVIIYAIVGLVIVALAQVIVHFVITSASGV